MKRHPARVTPPEVVVGFTEVWSTTPAGFTREGTVQRKASSLLAEPWQKGRYRLRKRQPVDQSLKSVADILGRLKS